MANTKKKVNPKAASKKAAPQPAPKRAPAPRPPMRTMALGLGPDQLLARLPPLDAVHRDAFSSQFTDSACVALGRETKSAAVRDGALAWASEAAGALLDPRLASDIDYGPERLTWVVELVVRLDAARGASGAQGGAQSTVRTTRDVALAKGKEVRARLLRKLGRVVQGDELGKAMLGDASNAPDAREVARSLALLADLVDSVTKNAPPTVAVLAQSAKVTAADATDARAAAKALADAKDDVTLGGRSSGGHDTPAVNLVEGRVLKELLFLRDAMDEARSRGVAVPALVPAGGLQHVLARRKHRKKDEPAGESPPPA